MNRITIPIMLGVGLALVFSGCTPEPTSKPSETAAETGQPKAIPEADQAKAIAEIEKLGGRVTVDAKSPDEPVIEVELPSSKVTDAELQHFAGLAQLQVLDLNGTKITDAGVQHLIRLSKLQQLFIRDTTTTEDGTKKLQQALPNCKITR